MGNGICHSVPFILGWKLGKLEKNSGEQASDATPGGFLLLWPLFHAGSLQTTPPSQKRWIISTLRDIGSRMGFKLAVSMAAKLEDTVCLTTRDVDVWPASSSQRLIYAVSSIESAVTLTQAYV